MHPSRSIRIFLSSTFRDFGEERDLLVKRVFPALRAKFKERFVELVDVDLRWGITPQEAERGEVLPICLSEIDRARPYFIGMLGERYGWIPPKNGFDDALIRRHSWLQSYQGDKSVTELEILHGVLNNPLMKGRCLFYFRAPSFARLKGGDYLPASADDKQRQQSLKKRIRDSAFPVVTYKDPLALAKHLEKAIGQLIDMDYPASLVPDAFERNNLVHESFASLRQRHFVSGEGYLKKLEQLLNKGIQSIVIEGPSGSGKSTLISNFCVFMLTHASHIQVHAHHLEASDDAKDPLAMVKRMCEFIKRQTGSDLAISANPETVMEDLPAWLEIASAWSLIKRQKFVFVIDALDRLSELKELRWWPVDLPPNIYLVVSCNTGPMLEVLKEKLSGVSGKKLPSHSILMRPLNKVQSVNLLTTYLARFNKKLTKSMHTLVMAHPLASNPLFICTLAEELRLFGKHEALHHKLTHYLQSQTVAQLFEKVLERVEQDCGRLRVKTALSAIWGSRSGLKEKEILSFANLKSATWAPIRHAMDDALPETGGKITFSNDALRTAVQSRYNLAGSSKLRLHRALAQFFHGLDDDLRRALEEPWQWREAGASQVLKKVLMEPSIFLHLWQCRPHELLGYWKLHWERDKLKKDYEKTFEAWMLSASPKIRLPLKLALASALWEHGVYNLFGAQLQQQACRQSVKRFGAKSPEAGSQFMECAHYLRQMANPASIKYAQKAVAIFEQKGNSFELVRAYAALGAVTAANGNGWQAREIYEQALLKLEDLPDGVQKHQSRYAVLINWFNVTYSWEALPVFEELVSTLERVFGREDRRTLAAVDILIECLMGSERWSEASNLAMSLYLRCYRTFGEDHLQTGYAAGKYGKACLKLDELEEAQWGLEKASNILESNWPRSHPSAGVFLEPLAETYQRMGLPTKAQETRAKWQHSMMFRYQ